MSVADWDNEYARLARIASQLRSTGSSNNNINPNARSILQNDLQKLDVLLEQNLLTVLQPSEIQRRKRLLQNLLSQQQNQSSQNTNQQQEQFGGGTQQGGNGGQNQQQIQTQVQNAINEQDNMINNLAMGMNRLKHQSIAINDETRLHINLLNDMDTNLDTAHESLQLQTSRAQQLRSEQSIWKLQLIVSGLFILLIVLIFLGLTP